MSTESNGPSQPLPDRPNLRHLKDQAKDLLKAGMVASLTDAQFQVARRYGFASWPKLMSNHSRRPGNSNGPSIAMTSRASRP